MIELYSGTPGSGKSFHSARRIYYTLAMGKPVICNFPINTSRVKHPENFHYVENLALTPEYLREFAGDYFRTRGVKEDQILLIIDEAQIMFNARSWDAKGRSDWNAFFQNHRHYGYEIILVAQFDRMLDRQVRSLIEHEYIHRKVTNFGWRGILLSLLMLSPRMFVAVKYWYPVKEKVGSEFFKIKRRYARLYDTHVLLDAPAETVRAERAGHGVPASNAHTVPADASQNTGMDLAFSMRIVGRAPEYLRLSCRGFARRPEALILRYRLVSSVVDDIRGDAWLRQLGASCLDYAFVEV